ncbi:Multidrug resistance protein MdtC [compost metagenome]
MLREGEELRTAIHQACLLRLRPILMTTAATVLGALPLVLGSGAGAESRRQIGLVIVGGMLLGTLFSLLVIPVLYRQLRRLVPVGRPLES